MYGSPAMNKDLNLPFQLSPYRQGKDEGPQMSSGMLRYRSAPSTVPGEVCEELLPPRASGTEAEAMFPRFTAPDPRDYLGEKQSGSTSHGGAGGGGFTATPSATAPHVFFQWHQPSPQEHNQHQHQQHQHQQMQNLSSGGGGTSLLRHGSSPAGLFANLNAENGFGGARAMGSGMPSFASRQGSLMSQISEIGAEGIGGGSTEDGGGRRFLSGYPVASWDDSVVLSDSFSKRIRDPSEVQNGDMRSHHHAAAAGLTHNLSLPKSAVDMVAMERYLQFQDAVPCKVRAKRGCATHPRSIAERVRRTRISERIKRLQELVPNMDKQTNTADMLDLAVDYIKDLQRQAKALSDSRANCACSSRHKP